MRYGIIFGLVFLIIILPVVYADCDSDWQALESFYEASKNEDYDAYISLMDTDYIYEYVADEEYYEQYVKAGWEVYDTLSYEIEQEKCNDIGYGSVIFFNLESELEAEGEDFDIDRIYVAVFEEGRLQFVMDLETFSLHQNQAYLLQYYNVTKNILKEEAREAEAKMEYVEVEEELYEGGGFSFWWIVLILAVSYLVYHNRKKIMSFSKDHREHVESLKSDFKKHSSRFNSHAKMIGSKAVQHSKNLHSKVKEHSRRISKKL